MARWMQKNGRDVCSECGFVAFAKPKTTDTGNESEMDQYLTPFCPFCGRKMYEPNEEDRKEYEFDND